MEERGMAKVAQHICNRIQSVFQESSTPNLHHPTPLDALVAELSAHATRGARVVVHGVGREGLMMRAFAMRLAHLGMQSHCVGDVTCPCVGEGDLLIASAGPGGFSTVNAICTVAREAGARVMVITAQPEGQAAGLADRVVVVPARTMADDEDDKFGGDEEVLMMGSLYEGALFVLFEMVVFRVSKVLGQTPDAIRARHTNLE
ncbi:hypothetical protein AMTRI_Chr09g43070 [Amborella trichopoda]|uniref:SIS domain-containing protein n=1 Tax=Amborella trichopoda TaxID=13333 RepID=U5D110_AMBTC|nr:uncharacterized protein LOC18447699 [Amborella trichopoda]ERN19321.1 hypothetical protein AMTR_s00069p00072850 [Amborella trichopoda]|eukprot:XP_011628343.1 uncharacterized protein LOC18447699 [Amborella trichopoda]